MKTATDHLHESDLPLDRLLTEGQATGCVVTLSSSERPPLGWAGLMDWRLHGALSQAIRSGIFTGDAGECGYFPWNFHGRTLHVLVTGIGKTGRAGSRGTIPATSLSALERNLKRLPGITWAVSKSEFPLKTCESISHSLPEGGALWMTV